MFDKLKKRPSFANCADDEAVLKRIDEIETEAGKVPGLEEDNKELKEKVDAFELKEKEAEEQAIDEELQTAFKEGRITEPQIPTYKALYVADKENARAAIAALPVKRRVMDNLYKPAGEGEVLSPWDKRMQEIENDLKK